MSENSPPTPFWADASQHQPPHITEHPAARVTPRIASASGPAQSPPAWLTAHQLAAAAQTPPAVQGTPPPWQTPTSRPLPAAEFRPAGAPGVPNWGATPPDASARVVRHASASVGAGVAQMAGVAARRVRAGGAIVRRLTGAIDPEDALWRRAIDFAARVWPKIWWLVAGVVLFGVGVYEFGATVPTDFYPLLFGLRRVLGIMEVVAIAAVVLLIALAARLKMEASARHNQADARFQEARTAPADQRAPLLDAALADWRHALAVCPRPLSPRDWGSTQFALARGTVARAQISTGGERETRLLEALVGYRAAAEVFAQRGQPGEWAQVQRALGQTQAQLAREAPAQQRAHLYLEAASALRAALGAPAAASPTRDWADAQAEIAGILLAAAEESGTPDRARLLDEALGAYREALAVTTRWVRANDWATLQAEVGAALRLRAQVARSADERLRLLDAAVTALDSALEVHTPEAYPAQWAATEATLGGALLDAAHFYAGPERVRVLDEAIATLDAAARALGASGTPQASAAVREERARAETLLAHRDDAASG